MAKILSFKEWLKHKVQLNAEKQKNRFKVHPKQSSDHPDEISVKVPEILQHNHEVKTLKKMKANLEQKNIYHEAIFKRLRNSLQDYVDQIVPTKPSSKQKNTDAGKTRGSIEIGD